MEKVILAEIAAHLIELGYNVGGPDRSWDRHGDEDRISDEWSIAVYFKGRPVMIDIWLGDLAVYRNWNDFGDQEGSEHHIELADPDFLEQIVKVLPGI